MVLYNNYLVTIWSNFSQIGKVAVDSNGVKNVRTTYQNFTFGKKRKLYFLRRLASNEIMTPKCPVSSILINNRKGSAFSNNRTPLGREKTFVIFVLFTKYCR